MSLNPQIEQYFKLLQDKKYKEAEELLNELKTVLRESKRGKGYWQALEGLLLTYKSNDDKNLYLSKILISKDNLEEVRNEFSAHAKNALHDEYDRGYFEALRDYLMIVYPPQ